MAGKCPICGKAMVGEYRPFCSKRCADIDLSRWLNGVYAIAATEADPDEEDATVSMQAPKRRVTREPE